MSPEYPRPKHRGLIEGHRSVLDIVNPNANIRDRNIAASLKAIKRGGVVVDVKNIRDRNIAASLKDVVVRCGSPHSLHIRDRNIAASLKVGMVRLGRACLMDIRDRNIAASLKAILHSIISFKFSAYPRPKHRGLIEGRFPVGRI